MANFRKNPNCPASQTLLGFQKREISAGDSERISIHLKFCEFCASEIEFYAHYPQPDEKIESSDIPRPLYELAEALLSKRHDEYLYKLIPEKDRVRVY